MGEARKDALGLASRQKGSTVLASLCDNSLGRPENCCNLDEILT